MSELPKVIFEDNPEDSGRLQMVLKRSSGEAATVCFESSKIGTTSLQKGAGKMHL
jgi:hypothetical protein